MCFIFKFFEKVWKFFVTQDLRQRSKHWILFKLVIHTDYSRTWLSSTSLLSYRISSYFLYFRVQLKVRCINIILSLFEFPKFKTWIHSLISWFDFIFTKSPPWRIHNSRWYPWQWHEYNTPSILECKTCRYFITPWHHTRVEYNYLSTTHLWRIETSK